MSHQGMMDSVQQQGGMPRLQLNPMELPFYQNLFSMADPNGLGYIDGASAAAFLQNSGLPRTTLHEIWRLADLNNTGQLDHEGFFVACRLVAHAQNNIPVSPESVPMEPSSLPMFDLFRPSAASEMSGQDSQQAFGSVGGPLGSMMDPNMAAAAMMGSNMGGGAATPPMLSPTSMASQHPQMFRSTGSVGGWDSSMVEPWSLTENDRQKYINVFRNTDTNADGFVDGMEAK
eukprot:GHVS01068035.1.p1 GENE.GHVS01068035.1~~GHVS01068035.1.p1  ORF type:complete len:231 (+),score=37.44 GHVS01068035.1:3-695(+)